MTRPANGIELFQEPFPHAVVESPFPHRLVANAAAEWPREDWDGWTVHYDNPLERKRACNDWKKMPVPCVQLLNLLFAANLSALWAAETYVPDASLWGGGMHSLARGGHLDVHEDSDVHPLLGWHRRLNGILFLNPRWDESWGGALELWDASVQKCVKRVYPAPGRLVLFATDDGHYHGVPEPLKCPEGTQRMTLATFWFALPRPGQQFRRPRASFVSRPGDDPAKAELQRQRGRFGSFLG